MVVLFANQNDEKKDGYPYNPEDCKSVDDCVCRPLCFLEIVVDGADLLFALVFLSNILHINILYQRIEGQAKVVT